MRHCGIVRSGIRRCTSGHLRLSFLASSNSFRSSSADHAGPKFMSSSIRFVMPGIRLRPSSATSSGPICDFISAGSVSGFVSGAGFGPAACSVGIVGRAVGVGVSVFQPAVLLNTGWGSWSSRIRSMTPCQDHDQRKAREKIRRSHPRLRGQFRPPPVAFIDRPPEASKSQL